HRARRRPRSRVSRAVRAHTAHDSASRLMEKKDARGFFDAIARRYDRDYALSGITSRERMERVIRAIAGKTRVLVLGIGTGRELPALLDAGHDVTGLDV